MAKIPMLIIKSMGNASNIINIAFTIFFIPPPALNDKINGNILTYNESEDAYYIQHGADAVPKKLGNTGLQIQFEMTVTTQDSSNWKNQKIRFQIDFSDLNNIEATQTVLATNNSSGEAKFVLTCGGIENVSIS